MSEQEKIKLCERIRQSIAKAQRAMVERKALLGEEVVIADDDGQPRRISAVEALPLYESQPYEIKIQ